VKEMGWSQRCRKGIDRRLSDFNNVSIEETSSVAEDLKAQTKVQDMINKIVCNLIDLVIEDPPDILMERGFG
jgi:hypothetical protein